MSEKRIMAIDLAHPNCDRTFRQSIGLGIVSPDPVGDHLGTGYSRFVSPLGIDGLAKEDGSRVDLLAVYSPDPGKGHLSAFIAHCQSVYETVCVWEDMNPVIGAMLSKRGYRRVMQIDDKHGELLHGWRWDRTPAVPSP